MLFSPACLDCSVGRATVPGFKTLPVPEFDTSQAASNAHAQTERAIVAFFLSDII